MDLKICQVKKIYKYGEWFKKIKLWNIEVFIQINIVKIFENQRFQTFCWGSILAHRTTKGELDQFLKNI